MASSPSRREFVRTLVAGGTLVAAALVGVVPAVRGWLRRLRPPGALDERQFLASCIKCGQCVQVCPVNAIRVADLVDGVGVGTPFIDPRAQACDFSCDALQCVLACPTGALTHEISFPHEVRMATARLAHPETCLAGQGQGFVGMARGAAFDGKLRYEEVDRWDPIPVREHAYDLELCDLCVRQCPIEIRIAQCEAGSVPSGNPDQCPPAPAIRLVERTGPDGVARILPEVLEGCVGCGVCEMICPLPEAAIVIDLGEGGVRA